MSYLAPPRELVGLTIDKKRRKLVGVVELKSNGRQAEAMHLTYLEATKLELEVFLLVKELLQAISQDDVRIIETAVLLVELIVLIIFHAAHSICWLSWLLLLRLLLLHPVCAHSQIKSIIRRFRQINALSFQ